MENDFLTISDRKVIHRVPFSEIVHFESKGMTTITHTASGEKHVCCKNLGTIYKEVGKAKVFFRVHTSHIVNLTKIKVFKKRKWGSDHHAERLSYSSGEEEETGIPSGIQRLIDRGRHSEKYHSVGQEYSIVQYLYSHSVVILWSLHCHSMVWSAQ